METPSVNPLADISNIGTVSYITVAMAGGVASYLHNYLISGNFKIWKFVAHVFVSSFAGLMMKYFTSYMGISGDAVFLMVGLGGYVGTTTLDLLAVHMFKTYKIVSPGSLGGETLKDFPTLPHAASAPTAGVAAAQDTKASSSQ